MTAPFRPLPCLHGRTESCRDCAELELLRGVEQWARRWSCESDAVGFGGSPSLRAHFDRLDRVRLGSTDTIPLPAQVAAMRLPLIAWIAGLSDEAFERTFGPLVETLAPTSRRAPRSVQPGSAT